MKSRDWLSTAQIKLEQGGFDSAKLESEVLLSFALGVPRHTFLVHPEHEISEGECATANALLDRRLKWEPLAYITGEREFYGRRFEVGPGVLVPRQETELLIDLALDAVAGQNCPKILDIGTGSGCIGITISLELPNAHVSAVDISPNALNIAKSNCANLEANVEFHLGDLWPDGEERFDIIVSNPPYVRNTDQLPRDVAEFEPGIALFAGEDGLDIYRRLATESPAWLSKDGKLILEFGDGMAHQVAELFRPETWEPPQVFQDLAGRDRAMICSLKLNLP